MGKGCFVYRVAGKNVVHITVRSTPSRDDAYKTKLKAKSGNLVSIDYIIDGKNGGPKFLRLADGSGWLFDKALSTEGEELVVMEPVKVDSGLWCFYVDNNPVGIHLRNHPIDDGSSTDLNHFVQPKQTLPPQQKIYCDKKVVDGPVTFYRIQGSMSTWLFDKRGEDGYMLIPEHSISCGLVAYQISTNFGDNGTIAMRCYPDVGDESKIPGCAAWEGNLVVSDYHRLSPCNNSSNGPFLRLTNGMGWLFEFKHGERMMREIFIETGFWNFKVVSSAGIQLRKQPIDDFQYRFPTVYSPGEILTCDRQIVGANGVKFYRVKGTPGWVFDKRDADSMMTPCGAPSGHSSSMDSPNPSLPSWTIDFVRGMAAAIEGIHEIGLNEQSRLISFSKDGSTKTRINVYYTTRTVGTALDHPKQGKTQLFRRDCSNAELAEIMRNPRVHTNKGYNRKRPRLSSGQAESSIDAEEEMRNTLLDVDEALATLEERRRNLVESIAEHDSKRWNSEKAALKSMKDHVEMCAAEKHRADNAREVASRTCEVCNRIFGSLQALDSHNDAVHGNYECEYCYKEFSNQHALNQHCNATGHW
mmetsp:Transcript_36901/g.89613  ORF Transcript_36901/g.89613 Transcript_36901/m.89613 type:complete len:585 (-) Transcript_36901:75-1829(-)